MELPNKRQKTSSPTFDTQHDFVSLGHDDEALTYEAANASTGDQVQAFRSPPNEPKLFRQGHDRRRYDPRNDKDRPRSKHVLSGHEPWILVRTKYRRRFVHNTETKESFWYIPNAIFRAVLEFEREEKEQKEKADNAEWAEQQLQQMRIERRAGEVINGANTDGQKRRRRSESLQREDEEAMMAELAAQAEEGEEADAKWAAKAVESLRPQDPDLESDSEYEVVEVTDSEGGEAEDLAETNATAGRPAPQIDEDGVGPQPKEDDPMEFGEEDIAWQLAQMGEEYGLDPGEYGEEPDDGWEEGAEGLELSEEDAVHLFRDLLNDYRISPFTPWEKIILDESANSILNDDRYTVLPNMKARREAFEAWVKDKAALLTAERAAMEKLDPRIPFLAFLQDKATPKLYWPEFKRKYKREAEMNDRKLGDKDREKLYREHINRLKLPESTCKADLQSLLKTIPLKALNRGTRLDSLPQQLQSHLHFISLSPASRDLVIEAHIRKLAPAPEDGDLDDEQRAEESRKRDERQRREQAMAERERKVDEERRRAEREGAKARRDLREEERELQRAMNVGHRGLHAQIGD